MMPYILMILSITKLVNELNKEGKLSKRLKI
jgi:hypothetical protein